jgi:large subunit ribosomal protein L35
MRERANRRHYLEHKSSRYKRRLKPDVALAKADVARIRRMLGI